MLYLLAIATFLGVRPRLVLIAWERAMSSRLRTAAEAVEV